MIEVFLRQLLQRIGVEGVSTAALILLVALALYAHKASKAGRLVAGAGSTVAHDAKVVAAVLVGLLVLGVLSADVERGQEVLRRVGQYFDTLNLFQYLRRWLLSIVIR